jgi:hypothetical protein
MSDEMVPLSKCRQLTDMEQQAVSLAEQIGHREQLEGVAVKGPRPRRIVTAVSRLCIARWIPQSNFEDNPASIKPCCRGSQKIRRLW